MRITLIFILFDYPPNREYLVVEFPEEEDKDGMPMDVISSTWVFESNGILYCFWPAYLRNSSQREKLLINHDELNEQKALRCAIKIKYSSSKFLACFP